MNTSRPEVVAARKDHSCCLCHVPITKGTYHQRWSLFAEGKARTVRVHNACGAYAREHLPAWTNGDGCDEGAVQVAVSDLVTDREGRRFYVVESAAAEFQAAYPTLAAYLLPAVREQVVQINQRQETTGEKKS